MKLGSNITNKERYERCDKRFSELLTRYNRMRVVFGILIVVLILMFLHVLSLYGVELVSDTYVEEYIQNANY